MPSGSELKVFLAGRVALEADGVLVGEERFPGRQGRLLFACLVAEQGRPVPRDELAEALWGEAPPATWEKALTVLVSKLRALLADCGLDGAKVLTSAFGCYRLNLPGGAWVDVIAAAEALRQSEAALATDDLEPAKALAMRAASLARPPFLPGEEAAWVEEKRRELTGILRRALSCLTEACIRLGDVAEAAKWAEETIALDPYRETGYRLLMTAHTTAGNRAEALRVYERCRQLLATELGTYPSPETESIYRELLRPPSPEPRAAAPEAEQSPFAPLKTESAAVVPTPFYRRPVVIGAFAGIVAAAVAIPVFALGGGSGRNSLAALSANSVGIVDATTGSIDDEVSDLPTPTRVAAGKDAVWVTSSDTSSVSRIDASSHQLRQTIQVGDGPSGIAVGAGDVWVANSLAGTVSRIDEAANRLVQTIPVGNNPTAVAFGEGAVWVTNVDDRTVSRIDPKQGVVEKTIDVGAAGRGIAAGGGAIWIGDSAENRVVRLDPKTNGVTQTIGVGSGPGALAFGGGAVWVANTLDGTVSRIDPATNQVRSTVTVGASPNAIAASDDAVWVANEADPTIVRLNPRTGSVVQTVRTGARPTGLSLAGSLWVAGQASAGTHRGGTLTFDYPFADRQIDPALAYGKWGVLSMTNDGLVAFKRVGGSEGTQLVPNLATSLPAPTDGGKTYAFQLRKGISFSNGSRLKAADVRSSFERLFKAGTPAPGYYASIRGGSTCSKRPRACDLSDGIVTDNEAGTVTFHLTAPDPEFLYRLAIPFASIVPSDTPVSKDGTRPVPATGPYVIRSATPKRLVLVRNRYFRVWNAIARPDGYVNRIEVSIGTTPDRAFAEATSGAADVANVGGVGASGARLATFETQHPAQVRTTPASATFFWFLNTRVPPFDNVLARQAVSWALDRAELVRIVGGPEAPQPTCQLLPPNFPGYRPYCPFTADAGAGGSWSAPDLAKARELVARSGTAGARVTFWGWKAPEAEKELDLARSLLTRLGYRVSVKIFPNINAYFEAVPKALPSGLPQAGINGWFADYPAASNFLSLISCSTAGDRSINLSGLCSRTFDAKLRHASELQAQDQDAAAKLWAEVDRDATDLAALVPTYTPRDVDLVSKRVGNYQHHPLFGVLLDQLWVR